MKKLVSIGLFAAGVSLLAQGPPPGGPGFPRFGGGRGMGPMGGRGMGMIGGDSYVAGAPFSAVEVVQSQEAFADGNSITRKYQTNVARDGQGRVRTEETVTPPAGSGKQPYTIVTILDYTARTRYVLDSSTMTAYQTPLRQPPANRVGANGAGMAPMARRNVGGSAENASQVVRTTLAPQVVNGVLASGTQHVETIPAGQIGNERPIQISRQVWVSNELKVPVQIRSSDPRFGTTVMELTNIVQAEPSGALFVVPAGYTVQEGRGPGGPGGSHPAGQMRGAGTAR
ncbi:MAG TPA: hypothetical protein VNH18_10235 [Bryobacteraceae bacterium]|nr:hypothetical protein [Bryobacteraceae bacterium]